MDGKKKWKKGKKYGGDWKGKDKKRTAYYQGGKVFVEGDTYRLSLHLHSDHFTSIHCQV